MVVLLVVTVVAVFVRADNLGLRSFSVDEVLHVFAARSLLAHGEPTLPSGERYRRALPVTHAVAAAFARWGESEATARIPSVVAGTLAVPAVYLVGASLFGRPAGLVAAFLLAFSPDAVAMSRFVRMYAPAQLLLLLGAWALYTGLEGARGGGRRTAAFAAWVVLFALAAALHPEALLLLPAVGLHAFTRAAAAATGGWRAAARTPAGRLVLVAAVAVSLVLVVAPGLVVEVWRVGTTRLPWFPAEAWDPLFYHAYLSATYGYLWSLAPAATVTVLLGAPRPGLYLTLLFWVPLAVLSVVVPTQSARYVFFLLPFLFLLLGEAGRVAGGLLLGLLASRLEALLSGSRLARPLAAVVFTLVVAVTVRGSPWFAAAQSNRLKLVGEFAGAAYEQWREAAAHLAASGPREGVVVTNSDHLALYYFGRIDGRLLYRYQAPHPTDREVERTEHGWRFLSYRSGAPSFTDAADLGAFVDRHPRGWLIVERRRLEAFPSPLATGVREVIGRRLTEQATPADASLVVFAWDRVERGAAARDRAMSGP